MAQSLDATATGLAAQQARGGSGGGRHRQQSIVDDDGARFLTQEPPPPDPHLRAALVGLVDELQLRQGQEMAAMFEGISRLEEGFSLGIGVNSKGKVLRLTLISVARGL